jgi:hypothetical protein
MSFIQIFMQLFLVALLNKLLKFFYLLCCINSHKSYGQEREYKDLGTFPKRFSSRGSIPEHKTFSIPSYLAINSPSKLILKTKRGISIHFVSYHALEKEFTYTPP